MTKKEIKKLFDSYGGVMRTSQLNEHKVYYRNIQSFISDGTIEQIRRGYYQYVDDKSFTDVPALVALFPDGVICMESALDYYGYTNRTPSMWQIAVEAKTRRNRFKIDYPAVKPHFVTAKKFPVGVSSVKIAGTEIKIYNRERTICDCLLHKNKMDPEIFSDAIKGYIKDSKKNISILMEYAKKLHVEKKMREVIGIWL